MKMTRLLVASVACLALLAGCKKSEKLPPPAQIEGVTVDMPKLNQALQANMNPEVRKLMTDVAFGVRYGEYPKALMALDQLSNNANVSDAEKKVVNEVLEQVKKVAQNAPAPPAAQ